MTATGKPAQIFEALMTRVGTLVTGSPTLPVAYPDVGFDPAVSAPDGKYLEVAYFPNAHRWVGLSGGALRQGLLQITVVWPRGKGHVLPLQIVNAIKTHFAAGTVMVSGTTKVKVTEEPVDAAPLIEDHDTRIPITISWTA